MAQARQGSVRAVQDVDGTSVRKYVAKPFEVEAFGKLSAAAIDAHLGLYQGYVVQTNAVLESKAQLDKMGGELMENPVRPAESLARRLAFELNGITLHELFFEQYLKGVHSETGAFERVAAQNFGRVEQWRSSVSTLAKTRGPGWAIAAFDEVGLPGFQFLQDHIPGTGGHTNLDFYDTIQGEDLMKNAVVMAAYVWHAANADQRMPRKTWR